MIFNNSSPKELLAKNMNKSEVSCLSTSYRYLLTSAPKNQCWLALSAEVQSAYDRKDSKKLYSLIQRAFGPKS